RAYRGSDQSGRRHSSAAALGWLSRVGGARGAVGGPAGARPRPRRVDARALTDRRRLQGRRLVGYAATALATTPRATAPRRSCSSEIMWAMVHSGTAKVGIRLSGNAPRSARGAPLAKRPSVELLVRTPVPRAPAKSISPAMLSQKTRRCQFGALIIIA